MMTDTAALELHNAKLSNNNSLPPPVKALKVDDDDDQFEDALEFPESRDDHKCTGILKNIQETRSVLRLFLDNRFESAKCLCECEASTSFYHGLGLSTLLCIKASLTCETTDIDAAIACVDQTLKVCDKYRRTSTLTESLGKMVSWSKPSSSTKLTEVEMHAELCTAECLLQRAFLTFIQDESLSSFVKGAYKIRICYLAYRECDRLLREVHWAPETEGSVCLRDHFCSGTYMGMGTFNLMISSLPTRVLRLLEFAGFPADKGEGLRLLEAGASLSSTLRAPLCALVLLSWHLVAAFVIDADQVDLPLCHRLIEQLQAQHPNGALIVFFRARYHMVLAEFDAAVTCLRRSIATANELPQLHHVCYWELMFCFMFTRQWSRALEYAEKLYQGNKWSKCTYAYMSAIIMYEQRDSLSEPQLQLMDERFRSVSSLRQRIAGKSLPMEKFCYVKSARYLRTKRLILAPVELLYFWSGFQMFGKDETLMEPILAEIDRVLNNSQGLDEDDICLCLFLKALCLRYTHGAMDAEICFKQLVKRSACGLGDHNYVVPNAFVELALLAVERGDLDTAKRCVGKAKDHKAFLFESRLHLRVHALNATIKRATNK